MRTPGDDESDSGRESADPEETDEPDPGRKSTDQENENGSDPGRTPTDQEDDTSSDSGRETIDREGDTGPTAADSPDERTGPVETGRSVPATERKQPPGIAGPERDSRPGETPIQVQQERRERKPPIGGQDEAAESEDDEGAWWLFARDVVASVAAVALLGMYIFAISGVWPPMVAIESGSMEPNMEIDDLVVLMDNERFPPEEAHGETGVVTAAVGNETGYGNYGDDGDVIVFEPGGDSQETPIIHRAMFWAEEGENWCERANPEYLGATDVDDDRCIAPNDGFITKGDNNQRYDQTPQSLGEPEPPVKPDWVVGTAEVRLPRLGWFRLQFQ